ncbi:hypothetical protein [Fodinicola feengrottensis]|uniref:hypothetical protein n=1 Tax=Fodinicola feengrottensis TaxID=435914 RepID=UPI0031D16175
MIVDLNPVPARFGLWLASERRVTACFAISDSDARTADTDQKSVSPIQHARGRVRTVRCGQLSRLLLGNPGVAAAIALDDPTTWQEDAEELAQACYTVLRPGGHLVTAAPITESNLPPVGPHRSRVSESGVPSKLVWQAAGLLHRGDRVASGPLSLNDIDVYAKPSIESTLAAGVR